MEVKVLTLSLRDSFLNMVYITRKINTDITTFTNLEIREDY